ncbi:hypothetical protein QBC44DRAFT_362751 [Cladorrhinum sp. PSN332]|nr:hypothetical protein QBC44DRAFT_362751 [Cladorrhinum sp. PSN332]
MDRLAADSGPRDSGSGAGPAGWRESTQTQLNNHQRNSASGSSATAAASSSNNNNNNQNGYHDGLIPTDGNAAFRNSVNYPEVVPSEFAAAVPQSGRNSPAIVSQEKTYPEVNTAPSIHLEKNYPEVASSAHSHHSHHPHRHSGATHPRPTPSPAPTALSTVHSVHAGAATRTSLQAWSEAGEDRYYQETIPADNKPLQKVKRLWKQPIVWVVAGAVIIIAVLAGILGAIATGKIRTSATTPAAVTTQTTTSSSSQIELQLSGQGIWLSCPSANNVNFTAERTPGAKTFRRQCGINFLGGDGSLGKTNGSQVTSLTDCLEECAAKAECAGAVWLGKAAQGPECWLKEFIGVGTRSDTSGLEAGVLWQQ